MRSFAARIMQLSSAKMCKPAVEVFGFELTAKEMSDLNSLNRNQFAIFDADQLA